MLSHPTKFPIPMILIQVTMFSDLEMLSDLDVQRQAQLLSVILFCYNSPFLSFTHSYSVLEWISLINSQTKLEQLDKLSRRRIFTSSCYLRRFDLIDLSVWLRPNGLDQSCATLARLVGTVFKYLGRYSPESRLRAAADMCLSPTYNFYSGRLISGPYSTTGQPGRKWRTIFWKKCTH